MRRNALWGLAILLASAVGCGFENPYSGPVADAYTTFGRGDTKGALRQLDQIIRKQPSPAAYQLRATIRITSMDFRGAEVDATNGLKLDPNNVILRALKEEAGSMDDNIRQIESLQKGTVPFGANGQFPQTDDSW